MFSVVYKKALSLALALFIVISLSLFACADSSGRGGDFSYNADFSADGFGDVIERYLAENDISFSKFSMGLYDTVTGETYYYNGDMYMQAGSMFKLPMNMIYCDKVYSGEMSWDDVAGNYTLSTGMEQSIVYSNNAVSYSMLSALAHSFTQQRELLSRFSDTELDEVFYKKNFFSPEYMISVLKTLYENDGGRYDRIIEFMKQANQNLYFCYYDQPYTVAHKYGSWDGNLNDSGIIYGPHPILLVVFTHGVAHDEDVLAQVCRIVSDYSAYLGQKDEEAQALSERLAQEAEAAAMESAEKQAAVSVTVSPEHDGTEAPINPGVLLVAGSVIVALVCILLLRRMSKSSGREKDR